MTELCDCAIQGSAASPWLNDTIARYPSTPLFEQVQLPIEFGDRPLRREGGALLAVSAREFVFLAKTRDQLREPLGTCGREKGAVLVALAIVPGEMREVLLQEWKEHRCRARLEKQRVREDVVGTGVGRGADQSFEISRRVGNSRYH